MRNSPLFILLTILFLVATACAPADNSDAVNQAVQATVEAMPTQTPVVVEVEVTAPPAEEAASEEVSATDSETDSEEASADTADSSTTDAAAAATAEPVEEPAEEAADTGENSDDASDATAANDTASDDAASDDAASDDTAFACPTESDREFTLIPMDGVDSNHPDSQHADLNLALRGYEPVSAPPEMVEFSSIAEDPPQFPGMFSDSRTAAFRSVFQIYDWNWDCGEHGCLAELLNNYEATMLGLAVTPGEMLHAPSRYAEIYIGGYIAAVLYAEPTRITFSYAREGTIANGFTVHLENVCVDPNLVALYQSANAAGRGELPAIRNGDLWGSAAGDEIYVAVRDKGTFLDPRSRSDWWK